MKGCIYFINNFKVNKVLDNCKAANNSNFNGIQVDNVNYSVLNPN